ncbi:molybdate transport system substrate-binding protein [Hydrogenophaga palleronii]|uniref:Molybdate transport system substrate-binding protein n=1 Tax=Hydrogenophaga palleronii TaxID=65655 RepID=A0ABU1WS91_9BURK|nr:molybdate ABC transporter substrate-binding protein [Hydrogenophaga palleronii]MDR7152156.1 molybdate transport system substrate-binding protein [Hydrogenophaga palleronii]
MTSPDNVCPHGLNKLIFRWVGGAAMALAALAPALAQPVPTVAAASDLKFAIEEVAAQFEKTTGHKLRLVFGSSGNVKTQLLQGAPFHLFMSADEHFVFELADAGKTEDRGRAYAVGRIGIMVPQGSPLKADGELKDLRAALRDGRLRKFAIANPAHAPYGARAMEALKHQHLWDDLQGKLVLGENISQAAQFATSGSTQGGIIAYSLALAPTVARRGDFALIPESWHQPLKQRMVLIKGAPQAARAFYEHLSTPAAQAIMVRYGFAMPKD